VSKQQRRISIKFPEKILSGSYANQMVVAHTREEFLLDFVNVFPPEGVVNARVIVTPGNLKRMIRALRDNMARYEKQYGPIIEAAPPSPDPEPGSMAN